MPYQILLSNKEDLNLSKSLNLGRGITVVVAWVNAESRTSLRANFSSRHLISEFFGRIGPNLRKGGMVVGHSREFPDGHSLEHGRNDLMNELATMRSHAASSQNLSGFGVGQELHETVGRI